MDVSINYQLVADAAQKFVQVRQQYDDVSSRTLNNMNALTSSGFKDSDASPAAKSAAERFKAAMDRVTPVLDNFGRFLEQNVKVGYTNLGQQQASRFNNINPGG